jgi:branched-chain amino acid transport system permease protein
MPSHALIINEIAIVALFAVSLDLVLGFTGIVSLGHAAFFGIGGMPRRCSASTSCPTRTWACCRGHCHGHAAGRRVPLTILRGSDLTRLMVTLGVALILLELANKLDWLTGGTDGMQGLVSSARCWASSSSTWPGRTAAYYSLAVLLVLFLLMRGASCNSPLGATLKAIRDNRLRAMAIGIPVHARLARSTPWRRRGGRGRRAVHADHGLRLARRV